jgi:Fic family protein
VGISDPLTIGELAAVDATYQPIPAFADWPQEVPRRELWDRASSELGALRARRPSADALESAVRTTIRAAAFDTGAIEGLYKTDRGLTMTVAVQAAAWQAEMDERQPDARAYFAAQLEVYELVMDVTTEGRPLTEVWIRHLHEILTQPQEAYTVQTLIGEQQRPLPRGRYKSDPNHVQLADGSIHPYAPVDSTPAEMARLVNDIGSEAFAAAHPVSQASYVHYCLVAIHPFADGNGRVARAVASIYFYRAASIPLLVLVDQRSSYLMALEAADRGDRQPFIRFIADAGRSAMGMVDAALRAALGPSVADALRELGSLLSAQGGLTHHELDAIASGLQDEVQKIILDTLDAIDLPPGVLKIHVGGGRGKTPAGYREVAADQSGAHGWAFKSSPPAEARADVVIAVAIAVASDEDAETFVLYDIEDDAAEPDDRLVLGLSDVYPELTVAAQFRIRRYVERLQGVTLAALVSKATAQLSRTIEDGR